MAEHVQQITETHDISVSDHSRGGRAWRRESRVAFRPVKSVRTYAVAMHELGHILGSRQGGRRLEAEAGAWRWAVNNRLKLSPAQAEGWDDIMSGHLQSYVRWARNKQERRVVNAPLLPDEGDDLWILIG